MQITNRIQVALAIVTITSLTILSTASGNDHAAKMEAGFKSLFNGKDLTNWTGNSSYISRSTSYSTDGSYGIQFHAENGDQEFILTPYTCLENKLIDSP